jgi:hypothetical protein
MNRDETLKWFEETARKPINMVRSQMGQEWYDQNDAVAWLTEAHSALESVFPTGHAVNRSWQAIVGSSAHHPSNLSTRDVVDGARGVFRSAYDQLKNGRLGSIVDGVRAESVSELLDQAEVLNDKSYVVASAVIAGGALESHLLHLCRKNQLTWTGDGSIEKYNGAIGQARNASGTEIYSVTYGKLVTAWGGIRNEAAHTPGAFARSAQDVGSMILGIREFVARHPLGPPTLRTVQAFPTIGALAPFRAAARAIDAPSRTLEGRI